MTHVGCVQVAVGVRVRVRVGGPPWVLLHAQRRLRVQVARAGLLGRLYICLAVRVGNAGAGLAGGGGPKAHATGGRRGPSTCSRGARGSNCSVAGAA